MRSYIKLYRPKLADALERLEKLLTYSDKGEYISTILMRESLIVGPLVSAIKASTALSGEQDFVFEWFKKPSLKDIKELIKVIDEVIKPTGCRYTISTKK
jgi:hypothetical protein